ncbi:MAG: septum formation protein Maf [Fimbriimonas ginsengisoli]|uniref:dTTP/UTP pyrophosphatase n=1 Tax=Fimbriimonas ginsengisoli TaxID=1005039 RepID=A0A931LVW2_FIMGI|nr:septum formation protein Maf [Fimbriimonas ginsengisoli]
MKLPVVLASASPRRAELLRRIVPDFEVVPADVEETQFAGESAREMAVRLAEAKATSVAALRPEALVIGADTVVALGEHKVIGKPVGEADARRMLQRLSGRTHNVITAVCLYWPQGAQAFSCEARVAFRTLSEAEVDAYVTSGEPLDKAGGYAIQGGAKSFVERVDGLESTVIGLPVEEIASRLTDLWLTP